MKIKIRTLLAVLICCNDITIASNCYDKAASEIVAHFEIEKLEVSYNNREDLYKPKAVIRSLMQTIDLSREELKTALSMIKQIDRAKTDINNDSILSYIDLLKIFFELLDEKKQKLLIDNFDIYRSIIPNLKKNDLNDIKSFVKRKDLEELINHIKEKNLLVSLHDDDESFILLSRLKSYSIIKKPIRRSPRVNEDELEKLVTECVF